MPGPEPADPSPARAPTSQEPSDHPICEADGSEVSGLDPDLLRRGVALRDWMLSEGVSEDKPDTLMAGLARRLIDLGVPIDRVTSAIDALHSEYSGVGRIWTKEKGSSFRLFPHGKEADQVYERSPFKTVHETRQWLLLDIPATPDETYGIIPELKEAGYAHYLCIPLFFTNGTQNGISFATRVPGGFDARALSILRFVVPTLSAAMEMRAVNQRLDSVFCASMSGTSRTGPSCRAPSGAVRSAGSARRSCSPICAATPGSRPCWSRKRRSSS